MTGKEKCEKLRAIRRQIAEANNIPYISEEEDICTYSGDDCTGTCPKCEAEIRYLERELERRKAAGWPVTFDGIPQNPIPFESKPQGFSFSGPPEPPGILVQKPDPEPLRGVATIRPDWENENKRIRELPIPLLTKWKLAIKGGFKTVGQLTAYTPGELEARCRLSIRERAAVVSALREMGLSLKEERRNREDMILGMMKGPNDW